MRRTRFGGERSTAETARAGRVPPELVRPRRGTCGWRTLTSSAEPLHAVACCYMSLHAEVSSRHHDSGRQFTATVTVTIRVTEATGSAQAGGRCGAGRNGKHGQSIRVATEPSSSTRASSLGVPAAATAAANLRAGQANICSARQASDTAQWTTGCHPLGSTLDAY